MVESILLLLLGVVRWKVFCEYFLIYMMFAETQIIKSTNILS